MNRHGGGFYIAAAAGFVADQKAQAERLDVGRLFEAYRDEFPFLVGGSDEDPFEHRQVDLAQKRLGKLGQIARLPGGHLTTNEQPEALAALIAKFERGLAKMQPTSSGASDSTVKLTISHASERTDLRFIEAVPAPERVG